MQPIPMQLSQKQETSSQFFCGILKSSLHFEHFQKKVTLIAQIFPKLRTPKNMVRSISKSPVSRDPSETNMVNGKNIVEI